MKGTCLILSSKRSVHANKILTLVGAMGVECVRVNQEDIAYNARVSISQGLAGPFSGSVMMKDSLRSFSLEEVRSAFYHQTEPVGLHPKIADREAAVNARDETIAAFTGLLYSLDVFWINDYQSTRKAQSKTLQHKIASLCGLRIPDTLVTNDPRAALEFSEKHAGVVLKALDKPMFVMDGKQYLHFSERISPEDMKKHSNRIELCPTFLQEYVDKKFEVRAFVIGERTMACTIFSQDVPEARVDWRRADSDLIRHELHVLPDDVARKLIEVNKRLGMFYGAMDLIVTPAGEYVFLETNPGGAWLWIEDLIGIPVSRTIAENLANPPIGLGRSQHG
jgi:glutathione synthase/RimK-type ligase-like ATP-grasp enzyme